MDSKPATENLNPIVVPSISYSSVSGRSPLHSPVFFRDFGRVSQTVEFVLSAVRAGPTGPVALCVCTFYIDLFMPLLAAPPRPTVRLRRLFPRASFVGCADILVSRVTADSRHCRPGDCFAALPGTRTDGTAYADDAIRRGAAALLTPFPLPHISVPQCVVPQVRAAYARLCASLHGWPSRLLKMVGITGTNGKTTVSWLVRSVLQSAGERCGVLGTIEYNDGLQSEEALLTTPAAAQLNKWLHQAAACGTDGMALELSSHALHQDRIAGTELDAAVITNITQDHFDYHGDFEHYCHSKSRIFRHCRTGGCVVLNADDRRVMDLRSLIPAGVSVSTFGCKHPADFTADILDESLQGTRFLLRHREETVAVHSRLIGRHNVLNSLAAAAAASHFGLPLEKIAGGLAALPGVPGRLERVSSPLPFAAFVDYAHTEDALRQAVQTLKRLTTGRLICVFGAGGDRDRSKRPGLGQAARAADRLIITSDNPRSENPQRIIDDILSGIPAAQSDRSVQIEIDREAAIRLAVGQAGSGDVILVAGKGHETVQILGAERRPFDDRLVLRHALQELQPHKQPA